ncbi:VOC family protein [Sphingomonas sp.]|uniref:VOC family protein n=1 Tax=Sphingomonas sp. TaxID=28214 RepID=UPI00286B372C|nr:VOC family protein [Sphingomonas sp.]
MFSHIMVGSNDIEKSQGFYDAVFAAIGAKPGRRDDKGVNYAHQGALLMVRPPLNGQAATNANGATVGFTIDSPEQVDAWHAAGVSAGGTSVEDPPGIRQGTFGPLYLAYLRDPDGNKLCALHRMPVE